MSYLIDKGSFLAVINKIMFVPQEKPQLKNRSDQTISPVAFFIHRQADVIIDLSLRCLERELSTICRFHSVLGNSRSRLKDDVEL